jgi:hypothetical protein
MRFRTARGPIRWYLLRAGHRGITLPPLGIYILGEWMQDARLRRHEAEHWRQARELGTLRFYAVYLYQLIRFGYWDAPLEVAARAAEDRRNPPAPDA